jgi:hypothetical protein
MTDVLQEAENLLTQLPEAVVRRKFGERLSLAATTLAHAKDQIARIKALLESAELIGYGKVSEQSDVIEDMQHWARVVGQSLETAEDAEALRRAEFEYKDSLSKAIVAAERAVAQHWRTVASDKFQPLIGLGKLLTAMNVPNKLGLRLEECGTAGLASINTGLATERLSKMKQLLAQLQTLQEERAREISSGEVGEFINALADQRATLAMVTPTVLEGLGHQNALDNLGVTTRQQESAVATDD